MQICMQDFFQTVCSFRGKAYFRIVQNSAIFRVAIISRPYLKFYNIDGIALSNL